MRKCIIILAAIASLAIVPIASAWHADGVTVTPHCDAVDNGMLYTITADIDQSHSWPGATVKSITPSYFPGNTTGTKSVTVVIGWPNSSDKQTFNKTVTLDGNCTPPPSGSCPAGTTEIGKNPLICKVVEYRERIVYVDRVEYKYVDKLVPGPTATVVKFVNVKGKTKIVVKTKVKYRTKIKIRYKVKVKKVPSYGICKLPNGKLAVPGAG